ncbi:MAG: phosphatase PAP2 family protein [Pseudomonadota bacterium]
MPTDFTSDFTHSVAQARPSFARRYPLVDQLDRYLAPAEALMIALTLTIGILSYALSLAFDQAVDWQAFLISFAPGIGLVVLGAYIRVAKAMPKAGMAAIAAGIYIGFSGVVTILIYLRFPFNVPMIDMQLMELDAWLFGYDWAGFTTAMADYPMLGKTIGWIYGTSLAQLFFVVFVLSMYGRMIDLHRVLVTGILSLLLTVAIWWTWPSVGPSAYFTLSSEVEAALGLVHGHAAGERLMTMAQSGNEVISPAIIMGTIAFPSYHTVMLCLAVAFVWRTWAFWPLVALNLGMVPSILAHGGHHMTDLVGGVVVFAIAWWAAAILVPRRATSIIAG